MNITEIIQKIITSGIQAITNSELTTLILGTADFITDEVTPKDNWVVIELPSGKNVGEQIKIPEQFAKIISKVDLVADYLYEKEPAHSGYEYFSTFTHYLNIPWVVVN